MWYMSYIGTEARRVGWLNCHLLIFIVNDRGNIVRFATYQQVPRKCSKRMSNTTQWASFKLLPTTGIVFTTTQARVACPFARISWQQRVANIFVTLWHQHITNLMSRRVTRNSNEGLQKKHSRDTVLVRRRGVRNRCRQNSFGRATIPNWAGS